MAGMTLERYNAICEYLRTGRVIVDLETGCVKFPCSHNSKNERKPINGYLKAGIQFPDGTFKPVGIHQIVAVAGGLYPVGMTIDHINGNKQDNRFCNLRVVTGAENSRLAWHEQHLATKENRARNENSGKAKLRNADVAYIKWALQNGVGVVKLAKMFGLSHSRISDIKNGKTWVEIQPESHSEEISLFAWQEGQNEI